MSTTGKTTEKGLAALLLTSLLVLSSCGGGGASSSPLPGNQSPGGNNNDNGSSVGGNGSLPDTALGDLGGYPFPFEPKIQFPPVEAYRDASAAGDTSLQRWLKNSYETLPAESSPSGVFQNASLKVWAEQIVAGMNTARAAEGLAPLSFDIHLQYSAQAQARDMALRDYFAHNTLEGVTIWDRFRALRFPYYDHAGENAAKGQESSAEVVSGWLGSEKHRHNMLNPDFRYVGVGVYFDSSDKAYPIHIIADFADFSKGFAGVDWYQRGEVWGN